MPLKVSLKKRKGGLQRMLLFTSYCLYNKLFSLSLMQRIIKLVFDLHKRDLLNLIKLASVRNKKAYYWLYWLLFRPETHQGVMPVLHQCDADMLQVWCHWHCCRKGCNLKFSLKKEEEEVSQKILLSARHCLYSKLFLYHWHKW